MFVELLALAPGAFLLLACGFGKVVAGRGRDPQRDTEPLGAAGRGTQSAGTGGRGTETARTGGRGTETAGAGEPARIASVTDDLVADLPLVAPERAGYGDAGRLLVQAALDRRARNRAGSTATGLPEPRKGRIHAA
ncbi:hypothetical protein [Kineosporia succinea]|uniref:Lipoprotein n=1 Tax=Kineosporia succinea TaxID=84632 RepID=A0ABT9P7M0_9ACTN|nr:hypothetical protein [Kineosporia succinea]MDP9828668.1 hypothetical protein [Kineosporia succinea]